MAGGGGASSPWTSFLILPTTPEFSVGALMLDIASAAYSTDAKDVA
jgi:hypothetical protein